VWLPHIDGRWYITGMPAPRNWYANVRANPRFIVHLKHGVTADLPATAKPVDEITRRKVITTILDLQNRPDLAARVTQRRTSTSGSRTARSSRSGSTTSGCERRPPRSPNSRTTTVEDACSVIAHTAVSINGWPAALRPRPHAGHSRGPAMLLGHRSSHNRLAAASGVGRLPG
jgi:hypothetical protein